MKIQNSLMLLVGLLASSFTTNPIENLMIFSDESVEISIEKSEIKTFLENARFLKSENEISFITKYEINAIQIFNSDDVLEYQIPVLAKKLIVSKSLFDSGIYKIDFLFSEDEKVLTTRLIIK